VRRIPVVARSGAPISGLPLALVPTVEVPLLLALHLTSVSALIRASLGRGGRAHRPDAVLILR
jgi:hypothetical protein